MVEIPECPAEDATTFSDNPNCPRGSFGETKTLLYKWLHCDSCESSFAMPRNGTVPDLYLSLKALKNFKKRRPIRDTQQIYGQYARYLKDTSGQALKPWSGAMELTDLRLKRHGLKINATDTLLFVSGGPGIAASRFKETYGCKVVVTELSAETVQAMQDVLDLDSIQYDLNSDDLLAVVGNKCRFDGVFIESVLDYCADLHGFVEKLSRVTKPGEFLLTSCDSATLGYRLWWQFEDGMPTFVRSHSAFLNVFLSKGFVLLGRTYTRYNSFGYRLNITPTLKKMFYFVTKIPIAIFYGFFATLPWKSGNRSLDSNKVIYIMQKQL